MSLFYAALIGAAGVVILLAFVAYEIISAILRGRR